MPNSSSPAARQRQKLKAKVGPEIWDRYMQSVERGILTQKEADAAMLVEHQKAVTKANRERKAKGPRPKSKRQRRKEHAEKQAAKDWDSRKHATGHRARKRLDYDDPATYRLGRR